MSRLSPDPRLELRSEPDARRRWLALAVAAAPLAALGRDNAVSPAGPERRWHDAAVEMKRLAESWGDQPYGAVLVKDGAVVGEGPSRVVKNRDQNAHAEREAIRDAQRRLGTQTLQGTVLYSTSRPCNLCEEAAGRAGVGRMYFGPQLADAGIPKAAER